MKKVFTNSYDVIHLFAQRSQSEARCSNVFFYGDKIYSYGHHYLLGEFIANSSGDLALMINDAGYSVTTQKHISELTGATRQYKQFFTQRTEPKAVRLELERLARSLQTARKKELYIVPALSLIASYNEFQQWNGATNDTDNDTKIKAIEAVFNGGDYAEYINNIAELERIAAERKRKADKDRLTKAIKDFLTFKTDRIYNCSEDYCRISKDGLTVETSQRVTVPISEAKTLYSVIKSGRDIKGLTIGGYTVIGLNGTLKIGCHHINKTNMKRVGEKLLK